MYTHLDLKKEIDFNTLSSGISISYIKQWINDPDGKSIKNIRLELYARPTGLRDLWRPFHVIRVVHALLSSVYKTFSGVEC
jgi:hypothetical protein